MELVLVPEWVRSLQGKVGVGWGVEVQGKGKPEANVCPIQGQGDNAGVHPSKLERVLASVWPMFGGQVSGKVTTSGLQPTERKTGKWLGNLAGFSGRVGATSSGTTVHYRPPTCVR
uniref:Uncharacterized protein n=1 Tax=Branchiostoma floridae TaxID=7739 RepID=C3YAM6_BRAFL|eukprot:XP_002606764.1 hypothetical protein BRAFLDRAFT_82406 [Branchiostoma floridae]